MRTLKLTEETRKNVLEELLKSGKAEMYRGEK